MAPPRLHLALLFAKDMKKMADFYHDALGLPYLSAPTDPGWIEFDAGGTRLALHAIPPRISRQINITTPPRAREETPIKLVFEVDDVDGMRRHLNARGATMFEARVLGGGRGQSCDGLDPEGNVFQLVAAPPAVD